MNINRYMILGLFLCAEVGLNAQQTSAPTKQFDEIKAKAEHGSPDAQTRLGTLYENGLGVTTNWAEAFKWYSKAAEQTNAEAEFRVGLCYFTGHGLPAQKLTKEDVDFLIKEGIDPSRVTYVTRAGQETREQIAVDWFRKAAAQGYPSAQYYLGNCYFNSNGVTQDYAAALKWYRKAAEQGSAQAQLSLGTCYYFGCGTNKDLIEAVNWYRRAAEQGLAPAQYGLGDCYRLGTGVSKDSLEAVNWYLKAADQGLAVAEFAVGSMYYAGDGVVKDESEGVKWWQKAADQGESYAQAKIGDCYYFGNNVVRNYAEAVKWFRKAADQGDAPNAQYSLGLCYFNGFGTTKDYVEAYKWLNLAAAQGVESAKRCLEIVESRMTPDEISKAQRLSSAFVPGPTATTQTPSPSQSCPADYVIATGSGFFITDDGYLVSNYHVVKNATKVRVVTSAGTFTAIVVQIDPANDLALLKTDGRFASLPVTSSRKVALGNTVVTVGFPDPGLQGFSPKLAKGEIAALAGARDDVRYFQISVPIQPGNSGGALVDERGNVVGIVSAKLEPLAALAESGALPENVNYAVKSSFLLSFLESTPDAANKLKEPNTKDKSFADVVKDTQAATVLVMVY